MKTRILIIDDDGKLNGLLTSYLATFDMECRAVTRPEDAFTALRQMLPDCIILDVMLPGMDGFEVCRKIRAEYTVPIIMLTARGELTDRVVGLELGADDYVPKPFEPRELVARIQAVLRRGSGAIMDTTVRFGSLEIDHRRHSARLDGHELSLTSLEFNLLALLSRNNGIVLNRDTILDRLKGLEAESFDRAIDVAVSRLRQKLHDDPRHPRFIKTVRGTGYLFTGSPGDE